jgi:hypothetical protein
MVSWDAEKQSALQTVKLPLEKRGVVMMISPPEVECFLTVFIGKIQEFEIILG